MDMSNYEIKRRIKMVSTFPSEYALIRLAGAVLMGMNEQRITGSRYLRIEDLHAMYDS